MDRALPSLSVRLQGIKEHKGVKLPGDTLHCLLLELLESNFDGLVIPAILELDSVVIVNVELQPARELQVELHGLLLETQGVEVLGVEVGS